ncbi:hypothetical protein LPC08_08505 [Roseomonas sp. OT10]|uniref:hypothetical protein n=1 Tax=Roseomonas cutis TaxID=2897332 RepID=UPI001E4ECE7F|nr:hypothetical protein [Roseomonas sp. OT10]UFN50642.1 hypothetical protein LPC08_08505 [Roseomonas sp. OT10]
MVRSVAEAEAALAAGAGPGVPGVLLLSAPGAAAWPGAGVVAAMFAAASARVPGVPMTAALDCGASAGLALDALRRGWRLLVLEAMAPGRDQVAGAAAAVGARLLAARPEAFDLDGLDLRRPAVRARLLAWLSGGAGPDAA